MVVLPGIAAYMSGSIVAALCLEFSVPADMAAGAHLVGLGRIAAQLEILKASGIVVQQDPLKH